MNGDLTGWELTADEKGRPVVIPHDSFHVASGEPAGPWAQLDVAADPEMERARRAGLPVG